MKERIKMSIVAEGISTFGLPEGHVQPDDQLFVLSAPQLQAIIFKAVEQATAPLLKKIEAMESRLDALHEDVQLERAHDRQRISKMERDSQEVKPSSPGTKTTQRIDRLRQLLKNRGGSSTFAQLQKDLDLSPSQLSKLVSRLDKRIFEVWRRAGGKHGEKVLGLRARLFD
jgi:hypothetical protein